MHEIVALHLGLDRPGQTDGARVVDADVDAAELGNRLGDGGVHLIFEPDVDAEGERAAAGLLDLLRRGIDRAFQLGIWLGGLGDDCDVGAVSGTSQRDRQPMPRLAPVTKSVLPFRSAIREPSTRTKRGARLLRG